MRVLVTGGTGYIGSHAVVELMQQGHEVVIADNFSNSEPSVLQAIEKICGRAPGFVEVDLAEDQAAREFFSHTDGLDAVMHFAAFLAVEESVRDPLKYYHNNLCSLINVLQGMKACRIPHLVFSSSCTVYGQPDELPIHENAPVKPAGSPYGHTKQMAEDMIRSVIATGTLAAISLRYFNPIGAHDSGLIGELPYGVPHHLVPYITQTASGLREYVRVFGGDYHTPDGTAIRDYIHVVDVAQAHLAALERLGASTPGTFEVYNLGLGRGFSVLEMIQAFEKATGIAVPYRVVSRRPGDIEQVWADTSRANAALAWKARRSIEEMMGSAWKWEQHLRASGWYEQMKVK